MNPVLIILIIACGVLLWFLLSFAFKAIGKITGRLYDDAKHAMFDDEENKENEEKEKSK